MVTAQVHALLRQSIVSCRHVVLQICLGRLLGVSAEAVWFEVCNAHGSAIKRSVSFTMRLGKGGEAAIVGSL